MRRSPMLVAALLAALLLTACGGGAPEAISTVPPLASTPVAENTPVAAVEATPPAGEFPAATEGLSDTIPAGADTPAIELGPGTPLPQPEGTVVPAGADTPAIVPGEGTAVPTLVPELGSPDASGTVTESAPATQIAPELAQAIQTYLQNNNLAPDVQFGSVAVEDIFIRVQMVPPASTGGPTWAIIRAEPNPIGYTVVWTGTTLTADEAQRLGIPAALIPQ